MISLNRLKVSTKILIPVVFVAILGNLVSNYISTTQMQNLARSNINNSLEMLTSSIFLTLRNAMNTGDPVVIKEAENKSREQIQGLERLTVAKSKETIEMYSPGSAFTTDKDIIKVFETKQEHSFDTYEEGRHLYRVIKPMIAAQDCLMCHANQKEGDVIGVIDLSFSLDEVDVLIHDASYFLLIVSIVIIVVMLVAVLLVVKRVTNPLKTLQEDLGEFFQFLSKERDTIEPFKIQSMDEIGEMIHSINENIEKTLIGIQKDSEAIKASADVCTLASQGDLNVKINTVANNHEINDLIEIVNKLISSMGYNINRVLNVLDDYSKDHYSSNIQTKGNTKADIKKLFEQVNVLGTTLAKLSSQNLKNGLALEQTSEVLSKNVNGLNAALNSQSSALLEISDELNEVTQKINGTSQSSSEMSTYAQQLATSSAEGKSNATNTSAAMDAIDEQVTSINDAITIIDQIAFQTNILSLNAAVEAATAGEAGKGFAVVAQEVRNLAARSAEAAKEIKELVETAKAKADDGKAIADNMIEGYNHLNENIESTTQLIELVTNNSKEQQNMINGINSSIQSINVQTQENVEIAKETNIVAQQASDIAHLIVEDASDKKFSGQSDIKIRKNITDVNYKGVERRRIERSIKNGENL